MIRRRRRVREIPFSFDSFLDIVANVVGIIIRLILIVWVGARSYNSIQSIVNAAPAKAESASKAREPAEPLQQELAEHRAELAKAQERLLAHLRQVEQSRERQRQTEGALTSLQPRRQKLEHEETTLRQAKSDRDRAANVVALSSAELRQRSQKLMDEIRLLEKSPPPKQVLRYRTPISMPVHSDELLFECNRGRVSFIDIAALLGEIRRGIEDKGKQLRTRWEMTDVAGPVGAFRLRYTLERQRDLLDALGGDVAPAAEGSYRYGLSEWVLEPTASLRGEIAEAALAQGSEFRQVVDVLDPQQTVVTFGVYPDSFDLFRRLRDYLYERDVMVAGRPLPDDIPIASSKRGTVSRGQ